MDEFTYKVIKMSSRISLKMELDQLVKKNGAADKLAKDVFKMIKTSQLRRIFGYVKRLYERWKKGNINFQTEILPEIYMLDPLIYYGMGRTTQGKTLIPKNLGETLVALRGEIETEQNFEKFCKFLEAFVAYHKYYEKYKPQQKKQFNQRGADKRGGGRRY